MHSTSPYRDFPRCLSLLQDACEAWSAEACTLLAETYEQGIRGTTADRSRSKELYQRACLVGDERACRRMY